MLKFFTEDSTMQVWRFAKNSVCAISSWDSGASFYFSVYTHPSMTGNASEWMASYPNKETRDQKLQEFLELIGVEIPNGLKLIP